MYTVARKNNGPKLHYATQGRLAAMLKRRGARKVEFRPDGREITVRWPEAECRYAIDEQGNVEEQLAWDL